MALADTQQHTCVWDENEALQAQLAEARAELELLRKVAGAARVACAVYWDFDKSMKAEVEAIQGALREWEAKRQ